jgi:hypothetical protein
MSPEAFGMRHSKMRKIMPWLASGPTQLTRQISLAAPVSERSFLLS